MSTILVTGVNGFIGSRLARHLLKDGSRVVGIDVQRSTDLPLAEYRSIVLPSVLLSAQIRWWRPNVCIHCAGPSSVPHSLTNPADDFSAGVAATSDLLDCLRREASGCRTIYLSSAAVYGNPEVLPIGEDGRIQPISPYGFHKYLCECLFAEYHSIFGIPTVVARIFSAYGPGLRRQVISDICARLASPEDDGPLELSGNGREGRDFVHIADIVRAITMMLERAAFRGETYNVGTGECTSIGSVAQHLRSLIAPRRELRFTGIARSGDPCRVAASIQKLRALGFAPSVQMEAGLAEYVAWAHVPAESGVC